MAGGSSTLRTRPRRYARGRFEAPGEPLALAVSSCRPTTRRLLISVLCPSTECGCRQPPPSRRLWSSRRKFLHKACMTQETARTKSPPPLEHRVSGRKLTMADMPAAIGLLSCSPPYGPRRRSSSVQRPELSVPDVRQLPEPAEHAGVERPEAPHHALAGRS